MKAVILAAGRGKRLLPLTDVLPKPTIKVNNVPLIFHNFETFSKLKINEIGIVVGYKGDIILERIGSGADLGIKIEYIFNEEWERGNGSSFLKAAEFVNDDFLLLMADHAFDSKIIEKLVENHKLLEANEDVVGLVASQSVKNLSEDALKEVTKILVNEKNEVLKFGKNIKEYNGIDIGAFLFKPSVYLEIDIKDKKEFTLSDYWNYVLEKNKKILAVDMSEFSWQDFDLIEDLSKK